MYSQLFCHVEIEKNLTIHKDHFCWFFCVRSVTGHDVDITICSFPLFVKFSLRLSFHLSFFLLIIFLRRKGVLQGPSLFSHWWKMNKTPPKKGGGGWSGGQTWASMPNTGKFFAHSLSGRGRSLYLTGSSVYRKAGKIHYSLKGLVL